MGRIYVIKRICDKTMILSGQKLQKTSCKKVSLLEGIEIVKKLEIELKNSILPGIGLSAPQIGINASVFILRIKNPDPYKDSILDVINPEIKESNDLKIFQNEGCLSFPSRHITTQRYNEIYAVDALHEAGVILTGIWAVSYQHELQHVLGLNMYDSEIKLGRNDKCFCNSGKKFKFCHANQIIKM